MPYQYGGRADQVFVTGRPNRANQLVRPQERFISIVLTRTTQVVISASQVGQPAETYANFGAMTYFLSTVLTCEDIDHRKRRLHSHSRSAGL